MKKLIVSIFMASSILTANAQNPVFLEKLYLQPSGYSAETGYNGLLSIKKSALSAQYINLARSNYTTWSIGTVFNSNTFAIGQGTSNDGDFNNPFFTLTPTGNVGIGTADPSYKLDVNAGTGVGARIRNGTNYINIGGIGSGTSYIKGYENTVAFGNGLGSGSTTLIAGNAERLRISSAGNFGIGTTSPGAKFDIVGAYNNLSLRITNDTYNDWVLQKRRSDNSQLFGIKETGSNGSMSFVSNDTVRMTVARGGNVGIGIIAPQYLLDVAGTIRAKEVIVTVNGFPDFVFEKTYNLPKLQDVDNFIQSNGHLPNIPSAMEVEKNGMGMADLQVKLLQKVEELTLYAIEQHKLVSEQQKRIEQLENALKDNK